MKISKYFFELLIGGILLITFNTIQAQNTTGGYILLSGEVVSPAGTAIKGVHILNTNTNELSISDESGFFSISMHLSHVLRFSAVGFRTYYYTKKNINSKDISYIIIVLQTVTIGLKNINIIVKEEVRAENLFRPKSLPAPFSFGYQGEQHELKPTLMSPISMLYDWLSKEGKQKRELEELLKQEDIKKVIAQRYETDLMWEVTGLTGSALEEFKVYCNLSAYFVTHASDYEFLLKIKECFNNFEPSQIEFNNP